MPRVSCFDPLVIPVAEPWDGETYFGGKPSASATEFKPVFGEGTGYTLVDRDMPYKWLFRTKIALCSWSGSGRGLDGTMPLTVGGIDIRQARHEYTLFANDPWGPMGEAGQVLSPRTPYNSMAGTFGFFGYKYQWLAVPPSPDLDRVYYFNGTSLTEGLYAGEDLAQYCSTSDWIGDYWGVNYFPVRCRFCVLTDRYRNTYAGFNFSIQLNSYGRPYLNSVGDDLLFVVSSVKSNGPWDTGIQTPAGTLTFDDETIPLYQGVGFRNPDWDGEPPFFERDSIGSMSVSITPKKFWTYGGKYDPITGLPT